jgi:hypothetical protein
MTPPYATKRERISASILCSNFYINFLSNKKATFTAPSTGKKLYTTAKKGKK